MRLLRILLVAISGVVGASAYAQGASSVPSLRVTQVSGSVYMIDNGTDGLNGGSNIAVLVGKNGLVLVDAQSTPNAVRALSATLKSMSDQHIRYVINTHCHGDHIYGNATFQEDGATLIAHYNAGRRMTARRCDNDRDSGEFKPPSITYDGSMTLGLEDEEIRIIKLPTGHTDGDSIVYFANANVVATGDAFVSIRTPFHSKGAGGKILGLVDALKMIATSVPEDAKVIPGHGPLASVADIRSAIATLEGVEAVVAEQIKQRKRLKDLDAAVLLEPWTDQLGAQQLGFWLEEFYEALRYAL